ncbi:MAG TPA: prolyl oligopeptidase family serine peptidase [Bryobacteraceae bacterium]|nr:prolyl oligopeptidase family serine peptidase [Bryobacteraceae bacterium]
MPKPNSSSLAPLVSVARRGFPFTDQDGQTFVKFQSPCSDGYYSLPVRSPEYRNWFFAQFFSEYDTIPTTSAFHAILHHLEAQADRDPDTRGFSVFRRVGSRGPGYFPRQILLDLANPECQFVEISPTGWTTTTGCDANFQTSRSTRPLPAPAIPAAEAPAALDALRACINVSSRLDWLRCLAWLLAALHPYGPFPALILQGPPSSGKTLAARILRALIDPSTALLSPIPSSVRELLTLASHNWILAFDHVCTLAPNLTDAFCRLSVAAPIALRETGTPTSDPLLKSYRRPILLTATDRFSCPADLAERALAVNFSHLPPESRGTEATLCTAFAEALPAILAALCTAVSTALRRLPEIKPPTGRCADALAWAMAASPALGCSEDEMRQAFSVDVDPGVTRSLVPRGPNTLENTVGQAVSACPVQPIRPSGEVGQFSYRSMPARLARNTLENTSGGADPLVRGRRPRRPAGIVSNFESTGQRLVQGDPRGPDASAAPIAPLDATPSQPTPSPLASVYQCDKITTHSHPEVKMKSQIRLAIGAVLAATGLLAGLALAQGTLADYQRGQELQKKSRGLVVNAPGPANWIGTSGYFWYYRSVKGGTEFLLVDATTAAKKPAFDHDKLAAAIDTASGGHYTGLTLPFAPAPGGRGGGRGGSNAGALTFIDHQDAIQFGMSGFLWTCTLTGYTCTKGDALPPPTGRGGGPEDLSADDSPLPTELGGDPVDGLAYQPPSPQQDDAGGGRAGRGQPGCAPRAQSRTQGQGRGARGGRAGATTAGQAEPQVCASFDGQWEALIENYNVFLRPAGSSQPAANPPAADQPADGQPTPGATPRPPAAIPLSYDGSEGNYYTLQSIAWSPDSKKLVAYRTRPGYSRLVHYIESSPADQVQPKLWTNATKPNTVFSTLYRKPGDAVDIAYPALFDVASKKEIEIDHALFPNAYSLERPVWWKDSRAFTFEYNQRGHQVYRVIEVNAETGKARPLIDEQSKTFIYYNSLGPGLSAGRKYRHDVNDGKEIVWASERDGWEHLYLYDGVTGTVKNQITKGDWVVRNVDHVDDDKRQIWFEAGGMNPGEDPYFTHCYRINFDGTGLTRLTDANGNHTVTFSTDRKYYVDTWSRVDLPPISQLRSAEDRKVLMDLEKGDASALLAAGFHFPEVFVSKGRDGQTDIWGTIVRPINFDPAKKYPVIEQIYAGPQGSFVPKTFSAVSSTQALAELGFIVVQIDGMGTSNRSKAFHDVAFKNLGDAGFPDRILWHKAAAAKYPYYDISRVGIYGTSAGGQNSLGGVLFHPEFYKVVVTNSGCHDNRMDKIWWNEQWMGWPVGPEYAASSNVDNAYRLQGKALIVIGEMDGNVDPASSLQVVNALVKANKHFDMLYIPGQDHGVAVLNTQHYRDDYFVHNLLGVEPPDWNKVSLPPPDPATAAGN